MISPADLAGTTGGAAQHPSGPGTIAIAEFLFGPQTVNVKVGQTITWTNVDHSPHQVTAHGASTLRTPVILKGQSTGLQLSLVERYVRDVEARGSSPLTPTIRSHDTPADFSNSVGILASGSAHSKP